MDTVLSGMIHAAYRNPTKDDPSTTRVRLHEVFLPQDTRADPEASLSERYAHFTGSKYRSRNSLKQELQSPSYAPTMNQTQLEQITCFPTKAANSDDIAKPRLIDTNHVPPGFDTAPLAPIDFFTMLEKREETRLNRQCYRNVYRVLPHEVQQQIPEPKYVEESESSLNEWLFSVLTSPQEPYETSFCAPPQRKKRKGKRK